MFLRKLILIYLEGVKLLYCVYLLKKKEMQAIQNFLSVV